MRHNKHDWCIWVRYEGPRERKTWVREATFHDGCGYTSRMNAKFYRRAWGSTMRDKDIKILPENKRP